MSKPMKQVEVQIMGQSYLLGCPEGGETRLRDAVEKVDGAMCRIRDAGKVKARDRIAVLAALNLAFDLAERPTTSQPANQPINQPVSPSAAALTGASTGDERVSQLLERLDGVLLAGDGRLL